MGSDLPLPEWASKPCIMGIDEAGRGPVLGPMVYGCLYCSRSYQKALSSLNFADSKTLKEEKREELFEILKADESIGWAVDVIDPRELSAKMLKKNKINLNEISHDSAIGLVPRGQNLGVLLTEVYVDTVGDPEKFQESRTYTSSSNPEKSDNEVHEVRPISQKVAKRKGKGKEKKEKNGESAEYLEIQSRKAAVLEKLVEIEAKKAEDKRITKYMDYLIMDTSYMTGQQKKDHERFCDHIRTDILKF